MSNRMMPQKTEEKRRRKRAETSENRGEKAILALSFLKKYRLCPARNFTKLVKESDKSRFFYE